MTDDETLRPCPRVVAVVTGGAGSIGAAVCDVLLECGYDVAAWDRPDATRPRRHDGTVLPVPCDVTEPRSVRGAVDRTHVTLGAVTFLVNAVGVGQYDEHFREMPFERWREIVAVNLIGAVNCVHTVVPDMVQRGAGVIVNICSIWSTHVATGRSAYIASKWGLLGATKALASELVGDGIRVCAVSPGPVDTPMTTHIAPEQIRNTWMRPEDVAAAVKFALSPEARHLVGGEVQLFGVVRPQAPTVRGPADHAGDPAGTTAAGRRSNDERIG